VLDSCESSPSLNGVLCTVKATDGDVSGKEISYSLSAKAESQFSIDGAGNIRMLSMPDLSAIRGDIYRFEVVAKDSGQPTHEARANVSATLGDCPFQHNNITENEGQRQPSTKPSSQSQTPAPTYPPIPTYKASVRENSLVGTELLKIPVSTRPDTILSLNVNGPQSGYGLLRLAPNGGVILNGPLDYEKLSEIHADIYATTSKLSISKGEATTLVARLIITIEDENDNGPVFLIPNNYKIFATKWSPKPHVLRLPCPLALDADKDNSPFSIIDYSLQGDHPSLFEIDEQSQIRLKKEIESIAQTEVKMIVRAIDNANSVEGRRNSAQITVSPACFGL